MAAWPSGTSSALHDHIVIEKATTPFVKRSTSVVCAALVAVLFSACRTRVSTTPTGHGTFNLVCDPLGGLAMRRGIDDICGPDGIGSSNSIAQNQVKNNLCAPQPVTTLDISTLETLQGDVPALGIQFGSPQTIPTPDQRPKLRHPNVANGIVVGEGSLVQLVGFVLNGHFSNVQDGEEVNCSIAGEPMNDIHIAVGAALGAPACESVTAEIIPHFRPEPWLVLATLEGPNATAMLTSLRLDRPLRFTGQLMFDASHMPCANGHPASNAPARASSWEIHPVYQIDVCNAGTSLPECAADAPVSTRLDQWLKQPTRE
jgi:hypothetical protein